MSIAPIKVPDSVYNKLKNFPEHMNPLGKFVFLRTYSRFGEKGKLRREFWKETTVRAAEYNTNLERKHFESLGIPYHRERLEEEAQLLFKNMYNLDQFLSGRTLWVGGATTGVAEKYPLANFNCSFTNIENYEDLGDLFYLLLVGTGVGFKNTKAMSKKMKKINVDFKLTHKKYKYVGTPGKLEHSKVTKVKNKNGVYRITVGDSKEGWVEALRIFFRLLTGEEKVHEIIFNYNYIRPKGTRLKTFGGTASGPEPMQQMFEGIFKVLTNQIDKYLEPIEKDENGYGYIRPIHILDIGNLIGNNVVVGGVRRTAEIFLFDADDWESIWAKYGINGFYKQKHFVAHEKVLAWLEENRDWLISQGTDIPQFMYDLREKNYDENVNIDYSTGKPNREDDGSLSPYNYSRPFYHRAMSNNSIAFTSKPQKKMLEFLRVVMEAEGEPGFINLREAAIRRLRAQGIKKPSEALIEDTIYKIGLNPCAEIILWSKGVCNLTTINVLNFVFIDKHGKYRLDFKRLIEAQRLSARSGLRMTLVRLELPEWDKVQQRDRLIGTSLTGWQDAIGLLGYGKKAASQLLTSLRVAAQVEAEEYARYLRVNVPLLDTTIKPEGTLSQVAGGVSSGLHMAHAPYFIRRVRISAADPLAKAVLAHKGWTVNPENGTPGNTYEEKMSNALTYVIDFPNKSGAKRTKDDLTIEEQFKTYFQFQDDYTSHNSSNTITIKPHEWDKMVDIVFDNWKNFVGVSFLALDGGTYKLAPYETCTKEHYEKMVQDMEPFDMVKLYEHDSGDDFEIDQDCKDGACSVR